MDIGPNNDCCDSGDDGVSRRNGFRHGAGRVYEEDDHEDEDNDINVENKKNRMQLRIMEYIMTQAELKMNHRAWYFSDLQLT
ncbi:unnamed protein product [Rotaria sp. Silwood1]|nr:unnamed protein product [Rotaria sp. Silwood1]